MSSRDKKKIESFFMKHQTKYVGKIEDLSLYILKKPFKNYGRVIIRIFKEKVTKFKPDTVVLPSDFDNLIKNFNKKFVKIIKVKPEINDLSYYVQICDILLNVYRRNRRILFSSKFIVKVI